MPDVPYQNAAQVEQALAARETAEALGQTTLVDDADKILRGFGITSAHERAAAAKHRKAAAEETEEEPKSAAPVGRSSSKKSKADA